MKFKGRSPLHNRAVQVEAASAEGEAIANNTEYLAEVLDEDGYTTPGGDSLLLEDDAI
jgi:hypothetical protein